MSEISGVCWRRRDAGGIQACSRSVDPAIAGDTTGKDPHSSNPSALYALQRPATRGKRLGSALHGTAYPMGASARLGENGRLPANRLRRPADPSTVLKSAPAHFGEAAKRSAERAATGGHVPPGTRGLRGPRAPSRNCSGVSRAPVIAFLLVSSAFVRE